MKTCIKVPGKNWHACSPRQIKQWWCFTLNLHVNINMGTAGGSCLKIYFFLKKHSRDRLLKLLGSHFGCLCVPRWLLSVKAACGRVSATAESLCQQAASFACNADAAAHAHMSDHDEMACVRSEGVPFCIAKPFPFCTSECSGMMRKWYLWRASGVLTARVVFQAR